MANIYNIDSWVTATNYIKNNIITINGLFYYCNIPHVSSVFATDLANNNWVGYINDAGEQKSYFTWKHSYRATTLNEPKFKEIKFNDGYEQVMADGINNILPSYNLTFENIDLLECQSILHFLETRAVNAESFAWLMPSPRGVIGRFRCKSWQDTQNFYNNYSITTKFDRSVT